MDLKTCITCKVDLPLDSFYRDRSRPSGRDPRCKECNKAHTNAWCVENRTRSNAIKYKHSAAHPEEHKARITAWQKGDTEKAKFFRFGRSLRSRLVRALKCQLKGSRGRRGGSAVRDLGCTLAEFVIYIEAKFKPGMTWGNHGQGIGTWQLDHIQALCYFDLTDREQLLKAVHFTNFQPLWYEEHILKSKNERRRPK